jgi:hypothetical protein
LLPTRDADRRFQPTPREQPSENLGILPDRAVRGVPGVQDLAGEPWRLISGPGYVEATLDWVNSEHEPTRAAEVIYDNVEVWLYESKPPAELRGGIEQGFVKVSWDVPDGRLEEARTPTGPWQTVITTNSSYRLLPSSSISNSSRFFRLKMPPPGRKWLTAAAVTMTSQTNVDANRQTIFSYMEQAASNHADLIVFPEVALQGCPPWAEYRREPAAAEMAYVRETAEMVPGPSTDKLVAKAKDLGIHVVLGMTEKDQAGKLYNAAVGAEPIIRYLHARPYRDQAVG